MTIEKLKMQPLSGSVKTNNILADMEEQQTEEKSFGDLLGEAIQSVNQQSLDVTEKRKALAAGKLDDLSQVVIAAEKSSINMQLTIQVRNRILEAYQEIMRMPL